MHYVRTVQHGPAQIYRALEGSPPEDPV